jgi:hypothetical protein
MHHIGAVAAIYSSELQGGKQVVLERHGTLQVWAVLTYDTAIDPLPHLAVALACSKNHAMLPA